ncbi:hypothetical protein PIB30_064466 [Stylosanthes scabra]|uniref:Uncharacterized protein n=1 Tax=Stylosanthes scabra TaxID=79078 RepID=A0ABU6WQ21_9FABA|nr:hypothetical protein [Stylosanthes scabra]
MFQREGGGRTAPAIVRAATSAVAGDHHEEFPSLPPPRSAIAAVELQNHRHLRKPPPPLPSDFSSPPSMEGSSMFLAVAVKERTKGKKFLPTLSPLSYTLAPPPSPF